MADPWTIATSAAVGEDNIRLAKKYLSERVGDFQDMPPDQKEHLVLDAARTLAARDAAKQGGFLNYLKSKYIESQPLNFEQSPTGKILDVMQMGPQTWRDHPASAAAATAGTVASLAFPPGRAIGMLPGSTMQMISQGVRSGLPGVFTAAGKAEQILVPAVAAGTAGFVGRVVEEQNSVPPLPVETDADEKDGPANQTDAHVFSAALDQAKREFLFETGGGFAGLLSTMGLRAGARYLRGDEAHFRSAIDAMRLAGVRGESYALQEVTNRNVISSASPVLGVQTIPFVSAKFGRAKTRVSEGLTAAKNEMLDDISPGFSIIARLQRLDPAQYSRILGDHSEAAFRQIKGVLQRYRAVRTVRGAGILREVRAQRLSSAAAGTRATALQLSVNQTQRDALPSVMDPRTTTMRPMRPIAEISPGVRGVIDEIGNMRAGAIGLPALLNLRTKLKNLAENLSPTAARVKSDRRAIYSLSAAIDQDITTAISTHGTPQLLEEYRRMIQNDADMLTLMSSHIGRRSQRVQTTFKTQKLSETSGETLNILPGERDIQRHQGPLDMRDLMDSILEDASSEEVRQFAVLMREHGPAGRETLRTAAARKLNDIIAKSTTTTGDRLVDVIHADKIVAAIQQGKPGGPKERAFWTLLEESGVDQNRFRSFITAADRLWSQYPPNANIYMARKNMLRGGREPLKNIATMVTGGLLLGGGAVAPDVTMGAALLSGYLLKKFADLATSPRDLQSVINALDPRFGSGARAKFAERVVSSAIFRQWYNEEFSDPESATRQALNGAADIMQYNPLRKLNDSVTSWSNREGAPVQDAQPQQ